MSIRVDGINPSATLAVDSKAKELRAAGKSIVSFAAGEPDFPTPHYIVDAAIAAIQAPEMHKYSPAAGLPKLRDIIAQESNRTTGSKIHAGNTLVANGAKQAIFSALAAIIDPGDEVLIPVPYWTTYPELAAFFGGVPIPVQPGNDIRDFPTVAELQAATTEKTKLLIWCSPSNPTGMVASEKLSREVLDWAEKAGIWILSDEIYRKLYYGSGLVPTLRSIGGLDYEKLVVIDGVSKTYSMTGWRVGWVIGSDSFINQVARLQSHMASNVNNAAQAAAAAALEAEQTAADNMLEAFARRREIIVRELGEIPGIEVAVPEGAFYVFPEVTEFCRAHGLASSQELALRLLEEVGVATVPGEAFGVSGFLRFSYALSDDDIIEGMRRIKELGAE